MNFLMPSALWALVALGVPLLIHLNRRSQQQRTDFAALRWLHAHFRPRRQPVVREWLLLLIRLLLLALIVMLLAMPVLQRVSAPAHWFVAVPGVVWPPDSKLPSGPTVERHWLSPGFPKAHQAAPARAVPIASLLRELDAALPPETRLTVLVPERLYGLDAELPQLRRSIQWQIVPGRMVPPPVNRESLPMMVLTPDPQHRESAVYFRAAYRVWQSALPEAKRMPLPIIADGALPAVDQLWVYLPSGPLPARVRRWVQAGGRLMLGPQAVTDTAESAVLWRAEDGSIVLQQQALGAGRILQWQQPLHTKALPLLRDADFPDRLKALLMAMPAPDAAFATDYRPRTGAVAGTPAPQPLRSVFLIAIGLLFLLERILATRPARGAGE